MNAGKVGKLQTFFNVLGGASKELLKGTYNFLLNPQG